MRTSLACVVLPLLMLLAGCSSVYRPKSPFPKSYGKQVQSDIADPNLLQKYNAMSEATDADKKMKVARRNQILTKLIYLVDQNYYGFENRFYGTQAGFSTGADAVNLGLTGAASVVAGEDVKAILAAVATGTTGFKTSIEKNFFDQQSRAAIVAKMRSLRALQLSTIQDENHMKGGLTAYSLEAGFTDIGAYYNAGTVVGALQSIAESAGKDSTKAEEKQNANATKFQKIQ